MQSHASVADKDVVDLLEVEVDVVMVVGVLAPMLLLRLLLFLLLLRPLGLPIV